MFYLFEFCLKNNVLFVDDITKQNHELMKRMRDANIFDSVWFYNCCIYGRTPDDKLFKFGLYDDIDIKIRQRRKMFTFFTIH